MGTSKTFVLVAEFKKISTAIECTGILKHKGIDDNATVHPGSGCYLVKVGAFKAKKSAEDVLKDIHTKTSFTFKIEEEKA